MQLPDTSLVVRGLATLSGSAGMELSISEGHVSSRSIAQQQLSTASKAWFVWSLCYTSFWTLGALMRCSGSEAFGAAALRSMGVALSYMSLS